MIRDCDRNRPRLNATVSRETLEALQGEAIKFHTSMGEQVDQAVKLLLAVRLHAGEQAPAEGGV